MADNSAGADSDGAQSNTAKVLSALVRALPGQFFEFNERGATRQLGEAGNDDRGAPPMLSAALSPAISRIAIAEARKAAERDCLRVFSFAEGERTFEARVAPVEDGWSVMVVSDATAALELGKQFEGTRRREMIANLAGGVAHDFNNMLCVVRSYADLISGDPTASERVREDIEVIIQSVERASELTSQLLAFSRPQPPSMEVIDVNRTVSDIERMLRDLIPGSIALSIRRSELECHVRADRSKLARILMNLAVNARDAMPRGGALVIESRLVTISTPTREGKFVRLSVADTGYGMDAETAEKAFEPFFTTKGADGMGLGLPTVQTFAEQMGGFLELDTEPARGTSVHLNLPVAEDTGNRTGVRLERLRSPDVETVLVVNDSEQPVRPWVINQQRKANRRVILSELDDVVELVTRTGLDIDVVVVPAPERDGVSGVLEYLRERNADLVVASRGGRDARSRAWLSTAGRGVRGTPSESVTLYEAVDQLLVSEASRFVAITDAPPVVAAEPPDSE